MRFNRGSSVDVIGYVATLVILSLLCFNIPALADPVPESEIKTLVRNAQSRFESGRYFYLNGDVERARKHFEECNLLLLEADGKGDEELQRRVARVFNLFYTEMAEVDPQIAKDFAATRTQVSKTFKARPVYEGEVQYHVRYLLKNKRSFLINSFKRSLKYIPMIREEFKRQGIPEDLAYMALIESGFRPDPTSHAGAKGLWQFMPVTAKRFGLKVSGKVDERLDPEKATVAAAKYLKVLHKRFGDWPLAVAAYNCGEGRVSRTMKKIGAHTYWELINKKALPVETQRYVPSIIAVTLISRDPVRHGLPDVDIYL